MSDHGLQGKRIHKKKSEIMSDLLDVFYYWCLGYYLVFLDSDL